MKKIDIYKFFNFKVYLLIMFIFFCLIVFLRWNTDIEITRIRYSRKGGVSFVATNQTDDWLFAEILIVLNVNTMIGRGVFKTNTIGQKIVDVYLKPKESKKITEYVRSIGSPSNIDVLIKDIQKQNKEEFNNQMQRIMLRQLRRLRKSANFPTFCHIKKYEMPMP